MLLLIPVAAGEGVSLAVLSQLQLSLSRGVLMCD